LIGQGERTQGDWLYQFLLDPQPVRRMTVLRMPRFNMSKEEARALVGYFAGVERILNAGVEVTYPFEAIPQQEDLQGTFWKTKTAEYVMRLKQSKSKDAQGKDTSLFDQRVQELTPVWQQILKDYQEEKERAQAKYQEARKALEKMEADLKNEKAAGDKKNLEEKVKDAKQVEESWSNEVSRLDALVAGTTVKGLQKAWEESEAYVSDGFRLLANKQLCVNCHQVGSMPPNQKLQEGPPLHLAALRLRPEWTKRWLANPQRFLTYNSLMPTNFPANAPGQYQQWFAGSPLEQVTAVRDALMAYPRAAAMPVNRYWALPLAGERTEEKKKTGEKK
jgi:hypothetical protein